MKDKRTVDELSIEELERILLMRKRESRLKRFRDDRRVNVPAPIEQIAPEPIPEPTPPPQPAPPVAYQPPPPPVAPPITYDDGGVPRFEDELPRQPERYQRVYDRPTPKKKSGIRNMLLLAVEIGAALGLVLLLVLAFQGITTINRNIEKTDNISATSEAELQQRQIQPTATPLISISQVVLPGGHIYDANGQHQFNMTEVPAPFRDAFREQLNAPRTEAAAQVVEGGPIRVQIPDIGVDAGVRSGDDWISLQAGVGLHPGSGRPGEGNMVLVGHDDIFGEVFRRIGELTPGEEIRIQSTTGEWYTYIVKDKQIVEPSEVWVLDQNLGAQTPITTLITCYPYRVNTHRMVVFAELVSDS